MKRTSHWGRRTRRLRWLSTLALSTLLASSWLGAGGGNAAPDADAVTMTVSQYENPRTGGRSWVFAGQIASEVRGEFVRVLGRECGTNHDRLITDTLTVAGGGWRVENPNPNPPWNWTYISPGMTFRAQWKDHFSKPYFSGEPARLSVTKVPGRRAWKVHVFPSSVHEPGFKGEIVLLQRQSGVEWVTVRRARLAHRPSRRFGLSNYEALFTVPTRGLRLRAFLPKRSALPCYVAGASEPWRT